MKRFWIKSGYGLDPTEVAPLLEGRIQAIEDFCEKIVDDCTPVIQGLLRSVPRKVSSLIEIGKAENTSHRHGSNFR